MWYYPLFMRFVLTMAFLAAASLRGAELGVPASATPTTVPAGPLTLEKAIDRTLLHNLGLTVTRLDALRSLDAVEVTESVFDPTFAWTNRLNGNRSATQRCLKNCRPKPMSPASAFPFSILANRSIAPR